MLLSIAALGQPVLAVVYAPVEKDCLVAPRLTTGVRGLAGAGDELAQGGIYALRDSSLADFEFEVIARTDVYAQQRGLEQLAHDAYSPALNRIRPRVA